MAGKLVGHGQGRLSKLSITERKDTNININASCKNTLRNFLFESNRSLYFKLTTFDNHFVQFPETLVTNLKPS